MGDSTGQAPDCLHFLGMSDPGFHHFFVGDIHQGNQDFGKVPYMDQGRGNEQVQGDFSAVLKYGQLPFFFMTGLVCPKSVLDFIPQWTYETCGLLSAHLVVRGVDALKGITTQQP